jgi:putative ABC transport system ATP-binding protein
LKLLEELHRELNTTVLLVTHDAHTAQSCERMLILRDGRVAEDSALAPASDDLLTETL